MHILVTTAGVLPPEPVARFAEALVGSSGRVTVMNVVQTPPEFSRELAPEDWRPFGPRSGEGVPSSRSRGEVESYVRERGSRMVAPVVAALKSRQIRPETIFVEADDIAATIIETAVKMGVDVLVIGATRRLFTESAWTSISIKVARTSRVPVLLIPQPAKPSCAGGNDPPEWGE